MTWFNEQADLKAKEHAEWFGETIKKIYYDVFMHGYKHGLEDSNKIEELRKTGV